MGNKVKNISLLTFSIAVIVRLLFVIFYPLKSYDFFPADSHEYVALADRFLNGNLNFDIGRFIRSPLYPVFIAFHKFLFNQYWDKALIVSQIILSGLTGVFLCKISRKLFGNDKVALITGILYAVYLPVFYYVYSFTSETLSLFLNVMVMYYLIGLLREVNKKNLFGFAINFSLAYLTRAEIILFMPFVIFLVVFFYWDRKILAIKACLSIVCIWFVITLPWALINLSIHQHYISSSNGGKYVFYLSNSQLGYADIVETPQMGSKEYKALMNNYNFYNPDYDSIMQLPQGMKQEAWFHESILWIENHRSEFFTIKLWNMINFFSPGLTIGHHDLTTWWLMFVVVLPFHVLFYVGLLITLRTVPFQTHLWFLAYFVSVCLFLTLFLYTERFRAYSIEAYYLIYASFALNIFIQNNPFRRRATGEGHPPSSSYSL